MPNAYVNKVEMADGTTVIDITDTTAVASDVAQGKYFYDATGQKVEGTAVSLTPSMTIIKNEYVEYSDGKIYPYNGWDRTDYVDISNYSEIVVQTTYYSNYNAYYNANHEFITNFAVNATRRMLTIPSGAVYAILSNTAQAMSDLTIYCIPK